MKIDIPVIQDNEIISAIFENAIDGILLADPKSRKFILSNNAMRNMLGYSEAEIRGLRIEDIHPEEDLPSVLDRFQRLAEGEIRCARRIPILRKDGSLFYADITASPVISGDSIYLIGFFRDVTELKLVEDNLLKNIHKLEILNSITAEISSSLETDKVFKKAVKLSATLIGGDGGTLAIYDFEKDRMTYPYHYNMPDHLARDIVEKGRGLAELTMRQGPVVIDDYPGHPRALRSFVDAGLKVLIAVPLAAKGRNIGALGIFGFSSKKRFTREDLKILEAVGRQVGVAIENAQLFEKAMGDMAEIARIGNDLRKSEEKFRSLVESVSDWIWEVDAEMHYTYASPRVREMLGYAPEEILGKTPWELMSKEEAERVRVEIQRFIRAKRPFSNLENWNLRKDGRLVLLETSGTPLIDCDGNLIGYRGVDRDITERKQAQTALKKSEEKFRSIVESNFDVILTMDTCGVLTYVSPAIRRLTGFTPVEMVGTGCREHFPAADAEKIHNAIHRLKEKNTVEALEIRLRKSDGGYLHIESNASPIIEDGVVTGAQLIFRDITEKKQLERQLRQKQKMEAVGTLTAGITHDFNNILSIIMGNTELAARKLPGDDPVREKLDNVLSAAFRAREVVRQLLHFSRKSDEDRRPILPVPVVMESLKLLKATIPGTISIREKFPEKSIALIADPTQLQQVVINLCTNAVHAMSESGGILEIALDCDYFGKEALRFDADLKPGQYVKFTVADTGCGIPPDVMMRIFDPYFTTKAVGEGTGMGLAVVHGIIKSHGGGIDVKSSPGEGSTFNVYFPAICDAPVETPKSAEIMQGGSERILFVDDEQMLVEMWEELLATLGYRVEGATDPVSALEIFSAAPERFDLVITDMTMPRMTGDRLARRILEIRPDIPIIICTGYHQKIDAVSARQLGITGYIEKPLKLGTMIEKIREVLEGR